MDHYFFERRFEGLGNLKKNPAEQKLLLIIKNSAREAMGKKIQASAPLAHFFPLHVDSIAKFFLVPALYSYQIQDDGLIRQCALECPKKHQHCR